jgi:hypothetical protein
MHASSARVARRSADAGNAQPARRSSGGAEHCGVPAASPRDGPQRLQDLGADGNGAGVAALAVENREVVRRAADEVADVEVRHLGHPRSGAKQDQQHGPVARALPLGEQVLELLVAEDGVRRHGLRSAPEPRK